MKCPECGKENEQAASFCAICGTDLINIQLDWRARVIFFATPPLLLAICMALAWDLGLDAPMEAGAEWGLVLSLVYFLGGAVFWMACSLMSLPFTTISHWQAGMFCVLQLPVVFAVSLPVQLLWFSERLAELSFSQESKLRLTIFFGLYVPLTLIGLFIQGLQLAIKPEHLEHRLSRWIKSLGSFLVLFAGVGLFGLLYLSLPEYKKEFFLAKACANLGMNRDSLAHINRAFDLRPDDPAILQLKSLLLLKKDEPEATEQAIALLEKAIKKSPGNAKHYLTLSLAQERIGKTEEAYDTIARALGAQPEESSLWVHYANLSSRLGKRDKAVDAYKKALKYSPEDPVIQNNLAYSMLEANDNLPGALDLAKESVRRQPGYVFNIDTLAWAYYRNGFLTEAFETIKEVRQIATGNHDIDFHYVVIANEIGILTKPHLALQEILSRPQVQKDPFLRQQVEAALASCTKALEKGPEIIQGEALPGETPGGETLQTDLKSVASEPYVESIATSAKPSESMGKKGE